MEYFGAVILIHQKLNSIFAPAFSDFGEVAQLVRASDS